MQRPAAVLRAIKRNLSGLARPGRHQLTGPKVSIIIPVYNVEPYLAECLDSALAQTYPNLQIVLINDGSTDGSPAIAKRYAASDKGISYHSQANAGLGATRNTGARLATGDYLYFLDSDDRLPREAIARMVEAATEYDADVVLGPLARFTSTRRWVPRWASRLHPRTEYLETLEDRPALLRNHYAAAKLYRRGFWDGAEASFREGVRYEDQPLLTRLLIAARGIVSLPDAVYEYRERDDQSAIHQQIHTMADLQARDEAWAAAVELLTGVPEPIQAAWVQTILGTHVHYYLDSHAIEQADYWGLLRVAIGRLDVLAEPDGWIPPSSKLALELLRADRHADYCDLRRAGAFATDRQRYTVAAGELWWEPVLDGADSTGLAQRVSPELMPAQVTLLTARWAAEDELVLAGQHLLPGLDLTGLKVGHEVVLSAPGQAEIVVPGEVAEVVGGPHQDAVARVDAAAGGYQVRIPIKQLADLAPDGGRVSLTLRSFYGGLERSDPLPNPTKWFAATQLGPRVFAGVLLAPAQTVTGTSISVRPLRAWVAGVVASESRLALHLEASTSPVTALVVGAGKEIPITDGTATVAGGALARLAAADSRTESPLVAVLADESRLPLAGHQVAGPFQGRIQLAPDQAGNARLIAHTQHAEALDCAFTGTELVVQLRCYLAPGWQLARVVLRSRRASVTAVAGIGGSWRVPLGKLPEGGYDLIAEFGSAGRTRKVRLAATAGYLSQVPVVHQLDERRWRTLVSRDGLVHLDCRASSLTVTPVP